MTARHGSLADLAQAGFAMTLAPSMQVEFSVRHVSDRQAYLLALLQGKDADGEGADRPRFVETVSSSANGLGVVVGTSTGAPAPGARPLDSAVLFEDDDHRRRNVFGGLARPNPTFVYETLDTFEALVAMAPPDNAPMTVGRALETRELLEHVTALAGEEYPLLSVQCPVQVPPRARGKRSVRDREEGAPPPVSSHGVRFAITLPRPDASTRIALADAVTRFCAARGYGLWIADTRAGHRAGNWFQVLRLEKRDERDADPTSAKSCVPVTFVGPARIGSSGSILEYLATYPELGVAACSMSTLDDLAFVHLQLVPGGFSELSADELTTMLTGYSRRRSRSLSIDDVLAPLGLARTGSPDREIGLRGRDYQVLSDTAFELSPPDHRRRMAVWFSWQAAVGDDALAGPLDALYAAAGVIGLGTPVSRRRPADDVPNLEYLICRQVGGVVRGKGKVSLPKDVVDKRFGGRQVEGAASQLGARWESAWKDELTRRPELRCTDSTVAWREWWLGHRTSSL